jgi:hypothetical protein
MLVAEAFVTSISFMNLPAIGPEYAYSDSQQANANSKRCENILAEPILISQLTSEQRNSAKGYY